jgi:thiol-disulfide isomerase/thioredoxin
MIKRYFLYLVVALILISGLGVFVLKQNQKPSIIQSVNGISTTSQQTPGNYSKASDRPYLVDGKPLLFMYSALYCPFCAAERWSLKIVGDRFGKWQNLDTTYSSGKSEQRFNFPTYDFYHAQYQSDYISFVHEDYADKDGNQLQPPDKVAEDLVNKYDSGVSIPFIMINGEFGRIGPAFSPGLIQGKSPSAVEAELKNNPNGTIAKSINDEADAVTAYLCEFTGGKPASACNSQNVRAAMSQIL